MAQVHRVDHRRRDFLFLGSTIHETLNASMSLMTMTLRIPLERTRQPGSVRFGASWRAAVGVASSSDYAAMVTRNSQQGDARDTRPLDTIGAAAAVGERTP